MAIPPFNFSVATPSQAAGTFNVPFAVGGNANASSLPPVFWIGALVIAGLYVIKKL